MTDTNQNFKVYRGDSHSMRVALTQADGNPYDPASGVTVRWRLAKSRYANDSEALILKEIDNGITGYAGGVEITLTKEDTDLAPGLYYHELKVEDGADVATAMTGNAVIMPAAKMGVVDLMAADLTVQSPGLG